MKYILLPIISLTAILYGCNARQLEAPTPPPVVQPVPDDWLQTQKSRRDAETVYIKQHKVAYDWFANFHNRAMNNSTFSCLLPGDRITGQCFTHLLLTHR
jgi:hypothetical protein